jgi:hypothetical protein
MAARRFLLPTRFFYAAPAALAALLIAAAPACARPEDEPDVPNAKFNFFGEVTGSGVIVRSGPGENFYPTAKLEKGDKVKVVGIKFTWLKIEPPAGSFSYIGRLLVNRHGDGKVGTVVNSTANIRAGSTMNPMKSTIQTKLVPGTEVKILAEEDEYYRIEPPAGAYLYVSQQYVRPVVQAPEPGIAAQPGNGGPIEQPAPGRDAQANVPVAPGPGGGAEGNNPAARPGDVDSAIRDATGAIARRSGSATQPGESETASPPAAPTAAEAKFDQLEADFADASQKPVVDQPLAELLNGYQQLTQDEAIPESLKRIADARMAAIKARQDARAELAATRKSREEMQKRNQALVAERQELEERIKETQVDYYTAVGTLRASSLQQGPKDSTLYRLTDPDTGRTLVYLRTADRTKMAPLLNQFIGVRGELRKDPVLRLNVIQPTETVAVDPGKLGNGIAASVMPPSLLSKLPAPTVSTAAQNAPVEGQ